MPGRDAAGVRRKVLDREDFGLCVCWPNTLWKAVPAPGEAVTVLVDGRPCEARVETERCNCGGEGWHEHRFLSLPKAGGGHGGTAGGHRG